MVNTATIALETKAFVPGYPPVSGCIVQAWAQAWTMVAVGTTGASGGALLTVPVGAVQLRVLPPAGYSVQANAAWDATGRSQIATLSSGESLTATHVNLLVMEKPATPPADPIVVL